jgi:hypothetical protein
MSDSQPSSEVLDVLSSIRRLVSEGRRSVDTRKQASNDAEDGAQDGPDSAASGQVSKLVLTPALRVSDEGEGAGEIPGADAAPVGATPAGRGILSLVTTAEPERASAPLSSAASLENTIAELEAAVAGIETEFEPDGGDPDGPPIEAFIAEAWDSDHSEGEGEETGAVQADGAVEENGAEDEVADAEAEPVLIDAIDAPASSSNDVDDVPVMPPAERATARGSRSESEFHGIMARFDTSGAADERLDAPITADTAQDGPPPPPGEAWRDGPPAAGFAAAPRPDTSDLGGKPSLFARARSGDLGQVPLASFAATSDDQADEVDPTQTEDGCTAQDDAAIAADADEAESDTAAREGTNPETLLSPDADEPTAIEPEPLDASSESGQDEPRLTDAELSAQSKSGSAAGRLHLGSQSTGRPFIYRQAEMTPEANALELDDSDDAAVQDGDEDADDSDLFNPLNAAEFDVELLRDMVAEVIREELRGTLGERITRNLRQLVRREIARALEDEK